MQTFTQDKPMKQGKNERQSVWVAAEWFKLKLKLIEKRLKWVLLRKSFAWLARKQVVFDLTIGKKEEYIYIYIYIYTQ